MVAPQGHAEGYGKWGELHPAHPWTVSWLGSCSTRLLTALEFAVTHTIKDPSFAATPLSLCPGVLGGVSLGRRRPHKARNDRCKAPHPCSLTIELAFGITPSNEFKTRYFTSWRV